MFGFPRRVILLFVCFTDWLGWVTSAVVGRGVLPFTGHLQRRWGAKAGLLLATHSVGPLQQKKFSILS